jgi:hypothetical protein
MGSSRMGARLLCSWWLVKQEQDFHLEEDLQRMRA